MNKKIFVLVYCFLLLSMVAIGKDGDMFSVNAIRYLVISEAEKTCQVGWGNNAGVYRKAVADDYYGEVNIPPYVSGYKVVSIHGDAFRVLDNITSVSIPYTVKTIGSGTFYNSQNLNTVKINCSDLNSTEVFKNSYVKHVVFGDSVKKIGMWMCRNCQSIQTVTMGKNVESIYPDAFYGCTGLKSVEMSPSLQWILENAFYGCSSLSSIIIPKSVKYITVNAFKGCKKLTNITIEDSDEALYEVATTDNRTKSIIMFGDCALESVYIGRTINVGSALYSPFMDNKTLSNVTFSNHVSSLPNRAFSGCTSLKSVSLPLKVTSIGDYAFNGCSALELVNISSNTTFIGEYAFSKSALKCIAIPKSIKQIGDYAFSDSKLERFKIEDPVSIAKFGNSVFYNCVSLDSIFLPMKTTIGYSLFSGCKNLRNVRLPSNIKVIPNSTFYGCSNLLEYDLSYNKEITTIEANAFSGCKKLGKMVIPNTVSKIGNNAFYDCSDLKLVHLPAELHSLEASVFNGCTSLTNVDLPDSLNTIGSYAFSGCESLKMLIIPNSVTSIGTSIINGCPKMKLISFSNCYIGDIPETCLALVAPSIASKYTLSNVMPLVTVEAHEASVELESTKSFAMSTANIFYGNIEKAESGKVKFVGLAPDRRHKVHLVGSAFECRVEGDIDVSTIPMQMDIELVKATNLTLYVRGKCNSGDAVVVNSYFENYSSGNETVVTGLYPDQGIDVKFNVVTSDGSTSSFTKYFRTLPIEASLKAKAGSTSVLLTGTFSIIDATLLKSGFPQNDYTSDVLKINGLDPNTRYNNVYWYGVETKESGYTTQHVSFNTEVLRMNTLSPKVVSSGNVIVAAESNLDDEETNVGFEWRRTDWTDDFPSNTGQAFLYEGQLEGYIRNLNTEKLWKFRPYYESASGNRYYGEWMGLDPTNTSYFEPTVHTYAKVEVQGNTANVRGYAMRGSDNITSQGFMYWKQTAASRSEAPSIPSSAQTVTAKGNVMEASLTDLDYETTYYYVAFATTAEGETFYGDQRQFTTGEDVTIIEPSMATTEPAKPVAYYDLSGRHIDKPQQGLVIVRMSDGTTRKMVVKK